MTGIIKGIKAAFGDVEMTPYSVMVERDGYEERLYPARKWACTKMKGIEQSALVSPMFRSLFNYISGKNIPNIRIDMTSPVTTYVEPGPGPTCESTFTMGFLIPEEHQDNPPEPADKNIYIENRPELRVLSRRYGGYATDEIIVKEARTLADNIKKNEEPDVFFDEFYTAGYDPPFKLFGRRNEIWFVKKNESQNGQVLQEATEALQHENGEVPHENGEVPQEKMGNGVPPGQEKVNGEVGLVAAGETRET